MYTGTGIYSTGYGIAYVEAITGYDFKYWLLVLPFSIDQYSSFVYGSIMHRSLKLLTPLPVLPIPDTHPEYFI
jgi:hypothetical protein